MLDYNYRFNYWVLTSLGEYLVPTRIVAINDKSIEDVCDVFGVLRGCPDICVEIPMSHIEKPSIFLIDGGSYDLFSYESIEIDRNSFLGDRRYSTIVEKEIRGGLADEKVTYSYKYLVRRLWIHWAILCGSLSLWNVLGHTVDRPIFTNANCLMCHMMKSWQKFSIASIEYVRLRCRTYLDEIHVIPVAKSKESMMKVFTDRFPGGGSVCDVSMDISCAGELYSIGLSHSDIIVASVSNDQWFAFVGAIKQLADEMDKTKR